MFFYEVNAAVCMENTGLDGRRRGDRQRAREIASKASLFNHKNEHGSFCFVSDIEADMIICGIISETDDITDCVSDFFEAIDVKASDVRTEEITLSSMQSLLRIGARMDYTADDEDVMKHLGLAELNRGMRGTQFFEHILSPFTDKDALYSTAKRLLSEQTLIPELDRIYAGKAKIKAFGHPVHYLLETDDADVEKAFSETLLQALYDNGRLKSRRYCVAEFPVRHDMFSRNEFTPETYDALCKSCLGGSIIVRCPTLDENGEGRFADPNIEKISVVCRAMLKFRNQVLTVISLPRVCEKTKSMLFEKLGNIGIVEIKEDCSDYVKAQEYLKMLCKSHNIRIDGELIGRLEQDKLYYPDELHTFFDEWYNVKMRTSVFPQYKDITVCRKEAVKEVAQGCAYDDLHEMIGLTEAKSVIGKALSYYKMQRIYKDNGIPQDRCAMHMVFTGNPGTAKTTVARLFARIMKENGLLSRGHLVEVGRSDLVGKYVGWTAQIVKDKFKQAMGGVLFIDEAYSLIDEKNLFGAEAINTIVQEMENRREDLVVIFAGYPNEMEKFLAQNPGLHSRIAFHVPFADYSTDELCGIARLIGKSKGITLTDGAIERLRAAFDAAKNQPDFGNGRYVRNVIEQSKMNQAERILSIDPDDVTEAMLTTIEAEDISLPTVGEKKEKRRIGFGA